MNLLRLLSQVLDHLLTTALRQGLELPPRLDLEPHEGGYRSRSRGWGALGWGIDLELLHMRLGRPGIEAMYGVYGSLAKAGLDGLIDGLIRIIY